MRHEGSVAESQTGRVRIRLRLENGSLVEIPLTQASIDALAELLASISTPSQQEPK